MSKNVLKSSAPLRVGTLGSDPASADNGTLFYNSSDGLLRMRENGQWQHIASRDYVDATTDLIQNFEWQPSVLAIEVDSAEIVSPAMGDRYLIAGVGLGAFSGHDNAIAQWDGTAWVFTPASVGMMVSVDAESDSLRLFDGNTWSQKHFELTTASNGLVKNGFEISIASSAAGSALSFASGVFDVNVDSSTIEVNADSLRVKADGIDQTHILLDNDAYLRGQTSSGSAVDMIKVNASGALEMASFMLTPSSSPVGNYEVANKKFVDDQITSVNSSISALNIDALTDVVISSASSGQILRNNGSQWVNEAPLSARVAPVSSKVAFFDSLTASEAGYLPVVGDGNGFNQIDSATFNHVLGQTFTLTQAKKISSVKVSFYPFGGTFSGTVYAEIVSISGGLVDATLATSASLNAATLSGETEFVFSDVQLAAGTYAFLIDAHLASSGNGGSLFLSAGWAIGPTISRVANGIDGGYGIRHQLNEALPPTPKMIAVDASGYIDQSFLRYNIDFGGNRLSGVATPTQASDAASKSYTDGLISSLSSTVAALNLDALTDVVISSATSGQVLRHNGSSFVNEAPIAVSSGSASADKMLKSNSAGRLDKTLLQYNIDFGGNKLSGVSLPTDFSDVSNKGYVDQEIASITSSLSAFTLQGAYQQDADGGGAVITTNSVDGALEIAGTQKLLVSAAGGLDITGGEVDGGLVKNSTLGGMLYIKTATNGSVGGDIIIEAAAGSSQDGLVRLKADGTEIGIAGGGELRLGVNGSDYMSQVYKHIIVLATGGSAVAVADLGFSSAQFKGVEVSYSMHSDIGSRVGTLLITTDGSSTSIADSYTETADLSVVFSAAMDGTNVVVSVDNDSASAANMRALLKKFQA